VSLFRSFDPVLDPFARGRSLTKRGREGAVPIPGELVTILKAWHLRAPWGADGLVFPDDATGEMVSTNATFPE